MELAGEEACMKKMARASPGQEAMSGRGFRPECLPSGEDGEGDIVDIYHSQVQYESVTTHYK